MDHELHICINTTFFPTITKKTSLTNKFLQGYLSATITSFTWCTPRFRPPSRTNSPTDHPNMFENSRDSFELSSTTWLTTTASSTWVPTLRGATQPRNIHFLFSSTNVFNHSKFSASSKLSWQCSCQPTTRSRPVHARFKLHYPHHQCSPWGCVLAPTVPYGLKTSSPTLRPYDAPDIFSWDDTSSTQLHHMSGVG